MSKKSADLEWRHEIASRFRAAIKKAHVTNAQAASMLGVKRQTMWLYLKEKATPGGDVLRRACQLWGISISRSGVEFPAGAFGQERRKAPPPARQMGLFDALEMLREAQLETEVIGQRGNYFELRIRIHSSQQAVTRRGY
jgi:transcriptional regulator with XRE-family HTH domain